MGNMRLPVEGNKDGAPIDRTRAQEIIDYAMSHGINYYDSAYVYHNGERSGAYIRNLRIQNGYTQGELAKAMNMDRSFLSRIEAGIKGCSVDLFVQFSDFFHVSLDVLILGEESDKAVIDKSKAQLKADIAGLIDRLTLFQEQL